VNHTDAPTGNGHMSTAVDHTTSPTDTRGTTATRAPRTSRNAVRITTVIAVSVVAAVAAAVSFMHMHELAARAGEGWRAWLVPLAIDGLVVAASMTMVVRRRAGKPAGWLPWTSLTLGLTASLAANIAAADPTLIGRSVAAWPPIALLLAYELLMDQIQVTTTHPHTQPAPTTAPAQAPAGTLPAQEPTAARTLADAPATTASPTTPPPAQPRQDGTTPIPDRPHATPAEPATILMAVPNQNQNSGQALRQAARRHYLTTLHDGLPCSGRELADMHGMSEPWGRYQIRAAQRTLTTNTPRTQPATHPIHPITPPEDDDHAITT
jgi:hypothetical protein